MKSCAVSSKINNIDQVLNDFTKCQGYDGQIISSQTKYRNTDQKATQASYCRTDQKGDEKAGTDTRDRTFCNLCKKCA